MEIRHLIRVLAQVSLRIGDKTYDAMKLQAHVKCLFMQDEVSFPCRLLGIFAIRNIVLDTQTKGRD